VEAPNAGAVEAVSGGLGVVDILAGAEENEPDPNPVVFPSDDLFPAIVDVVPKADFAASPPKPPKVAVGFSAGVPVDDCPEPLVVA